MNLGCRRFARLLNEQEDRELSARDEAFLEEHRSKCASCRSQEEQAFQSLNLLRSAVLEPDVSDSFNGRVLRRYRSRQTAEGLRYWSPALVGAALAGVAALAVLQVVTRGNHLPQVRVPGAESRRYEAAPPTRLLELPPVTRDR